MVAFVDLQQASCGTEAAGTWQLELASYLLEGASFALI